MNVILSPVNSNYNGYTITTDKSLMNVADIYRWLSEESYWCKQIPMETFRASFDHSFCIGALTGDRQIAYGRLVTDYATFAYLADVYVEEAHRGKGISKKMMQLLFDLDWVKGLRHIALATVDAHGLYKQVGFTALKYPDRYMHILRSGMYEQKEQSKPL